MTNHNDRRILGLMSGYSISVLSESQGTAYAHCLVDHLFVDHLFVEDAAMWAILDIYVNDQKIVDVVEPPLATSGRGERAPGGEIFHGKTWPYAGRHGIELVHGHAEIPLRPIHLRKGDEIAVRVQRIGGEEDSFRGCLVGALSQSRVKTEAKPSRPAARRIRVVETSETSDSVKPSTTCEFSLDITEAMDPDRLLIHDPERWVINDLFVHTSKKRRGGMADSLFLQSGDVPASLFSDRPGCPNLVLRRLVPGDRVTIQATNCSETSAQLTVEIRGSAVVNAADKEGAVRRPTSWVLPMSSGIEILSSTTAKITARPQDHQLPEGSVFVPDGLVIGMTSEEARSFLVSLIFIGRESQLAGEIDNEVPASFLSGDFRSASSTLGPVRHHDPVMIEVTNISKTNLPLVAGIVAGIIGHVIQI